MREKHSHEHDKCGRKCRFILWALGQRAQPPTLVRPPRELRLPRSEGFAYWCWTRTNQGRTEEKG